MKQFKHLSKFLNKKVKFYHNDFIDKCDGILREVNKEYIIIETKSNIWKDTDEYDCFRLIPWHHINFIDSEEIKK